MLVTAAAPLTACGSSHRATQSSAPPASTVPTPGAPATRASNRAPAWPTYHLGPARTGAISTGPKLGQVRRLWSSPVDGAVYGEPLVVRGIVIVATEQDSVYGFDANSGQQRWRNHLATPVSGGDLPCGNIDPSGITSTPVADPAAGVVYVVAFESGMRHTLYALSVQSGRVLWGRSIDAPGVDPRVEQQRSALALGNGEVYVAYGGLYGDCGDFHGALVAAPGRDPSGPLSTYRVPSPGEGGIWAPSGPALDAAGAIYIATGNGSSSSFDYGNSVIKLSPAFQQLGFFAPDNAGALNQTDLDLGSTGPILLPHHQSFIIGKSGIGYLLNTDRLGGVGHPLSSASLCDRAFGGMAYGHGVLYVPCTNGLAAATVSGDSLTTKWRQGAANEPPIVAGPGVWSVGGAQLFQLDPVNGQVSFSATIGTPAPFTTPSASAGRVYVAAGERLQAFG